jgi:predicted DNA-binding transcriptional regulator AlpA
MSWMKIDAARTYAGGISRKVIYRAVASGQLRAARIGTGRSLLFCEPWIDEWLRATVTAVPAEEIGTVASGTRGVVSDPPLRLVKSA